LPLLALVVVVVGLGFFMFTKSQALQLRWRQVTAAGRVDDDMRFAIWAPAVKIWREHIWLGAGPDHFDWRFPAYRPDTVQRRPNRVHNDYLNTLADWGIVGAALVASVWIVLALMLWKTWRYVRRLPADLGARKGSGKFAFVWGASLGLAAILAHSFVDFNLHVPANAFIVVVLLALLSSHIRFATERFWVGGGLWAKVVATCLFLLPAAWLFEQSCSRSVESHWQARAARAPSFSTKQLALLEKAFAAEPKNGLTARGIAECYRVQSAEGGANYRELGLKALEGFGLAMKLNPLDPESSARYGWCLDWLDRSGEAWPYFSRAEELDPNGYLTVAKVGLHFEEIGDFAAARSWFERSLRLQPANNPIATSHFRVAIEKLTEAAKQGAGSGVTSTGR